MRRYEAEAGPLAVAAARPALGDAAIEPGRVTHLVTVSCTGSCAPGFDMALIRGLGLPRDVARTHVGFMGCHGLLNGLRVAQAFVAADPAAVPLVCAVELCSLHHQYEGDAEQIVANALFADGAGAVVGIAAGSTPVGNADAYRLVASGSTIIDDSDDAMSWRVGDRGFVMTLSPRVPELIARHLRPWLEGWLARHGLDLDLGRLVGRPPRRPADRLGRRRGARPRPRAALAQPAGAGGVREHVVPDGPLHPRPPPPGQRPAPLRVPRLRPRPGRRGGVIRVAAVGPQGKVEITPAMRSAWMESK